MYIYVAHILNVGYLKKIFENFERQTEIKQGLYAGQHGR
jgi:hypothetical protein